MAIFNVKLTPLFSKSIIRLKRHFDKFQIEYSSIYFKPVVEINSGKTLDRITSYCTMLNDTMFLLPLRMYKLNKMDISRKTQNIHHVFFKKIEEFHKISNNKAIITGAKKSFELLEDVNRQLSNDATHR